MGLILARAFRFEDEHAAAFVGAGGKTTAIFQLARELKSPVIVTTTTHLGRWQVELADQHVIASRRSDLAALKPLGVSLITGAFTSDDRAGAVGAEVLSGLGDFSRERGVHLLIEADGSRQKPLKAPASHEPPVPDFVDLVVVVAGLGGLGKPLTEHAVHRAEIFAALSGLQMGEVITPDALVRVLIHPEGGRKNIPSRARRIVLLGQADTDDVQAQASAMARELLTAFDAVVVAQLQEHIVHAVYEPVAGIVLAAGGSRRLGRPKPLLDWHGQPFVHAVAATALKAGLDPVVVVTGARAPDVQRALEGMEIVTYHNAEWQSGQSSSIRAGLSRIPPSSGAVVFLLADQPQVTFNVISALVDTHARGLYPIVAPLVMMEQRANPVLFDRSTFPDLLTLQGDVGGRAIFSKHRVEYVPWHDDSLLLDVDTEADYRRLVEDDTL